MASERKWFTMVLPEVRKPAGYGRLAHVVMVDDSTRELWFQHEQDPTILRCIRINLDEEKHEKPKTILTKGKRDRDD
jgi:hypothetical protein